MILWKVTRAEHLGRNLFGPGKKRLGSVRMTDEDFKITSQRDRILIKSAQFEGWLPEIRRNWQSDGTEFSLLIDPVSEEYAPVFFEVSPKSIRRAEKLLDEKYRD